MSKPAPIKDFEILSRLSSVKALAHKDRLAILGLLKDDPMTASMLAKSLGIPANQANYHLGVLQNEGLAWESGRGKKRWKEERYYRAQAQNYVVDPGLGCPDERVSKAVLHSVEAAFLDWRRAQVLHVDFARIARRVVRDSLRARPGNVVLVLFMPAGLELAEAVQVELRSVGAEPRPLMWSHRVAIGILDHYTSEALRTFELLDTELDRSLNACIFISSNMPGGSEPNPEQREKLPLLLESVSRWHVSLRERRVPYVEVALPHRGEFDSGIAPPEEAITAFWRCLESKGEEISRRAAELLAKVGGNTKFSIRDTGPTHLSVECDLTRPFISDGVISEDDIARGDTFENLPAGSLSFLPVPGTAHGTLFLEHVFVVGRRFHDVTFTIAEGRITSLDSPNDVGVLREMLRSAAGEPDRLAEIGIGLNPGGHALTGKPVLDACMEGTVTLTFGNNELIGGDVRSTLTLILPTRSLSVSAGEKEIL